MNEKEAYRIVKKYNCSLHQVSDYKTKDNNIVDGNELCPRCDGTGNELFSMYRKCEACDGSGVKNDGYDYDD